MTTNVANSSPDSEKLKANLARIEALSQRLVAAIAQKRPANPALEAPGIDLYGRAANAWWNEALKDPTKMMEQQVAFWGKSLNHYMEVQKLLASGESAALVDAAPPDRRFSNPLWQTHPYFNFIKQQYLMNVEAMDNAVAAIEGLEGQDRRRLEYFVGQMMDLLSPTNFLATNPDALEKAVATEGESLVKGLENLVHDVEANRGDLLVTLADRDSFEVGGNIATTKGAVVFRNHMFELIQYEPTTKQVHAVPVVIFPPWINKFYIMDLKEKNSLIKWIVDQGFTLFVVSWKNPDASYAGIGMSDYVEDGFLTAIAEVKAITGQNKVNAVGYCIAGTTLSTTLALMKKRGDDSVKSATLFTTMTDFSDPGEVGVFLDNDFVDGIEAEVTRAGYLDKYFMARTFSFLRANDLIYGPAIKSYMLGEAPPAFDLLFWNGDGTNLPARMAVEYLRGLCQGNRLVDGGFEVCGERVTLSDVKIPICAIACETDHIAPWKASYNGVRRMGSKDKTFILAQSGHIAGIINPPSKGKYGHYTHDTLPRTADAWREGAGFNEGSWWPRWADWLGARSGKMVGARGAGGADHPVLCAAPGKYVTEVPNA
ncbi:MAG: class I poly(R)-hydroxyalkanoic acid synthase [Albidovulum sp.]